MNDPHKFKDEYQKIANEKRKRDNDEYSQRRAFDFQQTIQEFKDGFIEHDEKGNRITKKDKVDEIVRSFLKKYDRNTTMDTNYQFMQLWAMFMALGEQLQEVSGVLTLKAGNYFGSGLEFAGRWISEYKNAPLEPLIHFADMNDDNELVTKPLENKDGIDLGGRLDANYKQCIVEWLAENNCTPDAENPKTFKKADGTVLTKAEFSQMFNNPTTGFCHYLEEKADVSFSASPKMGM